MGKAKMVGQFRPYASNRTASTPGRKQMVMVVGPPNISRREKKALVKRFMEEKEKRNAE